MADQSLAKNYEFAIFDKWAGYNSCSDPSKLPPGFIVRGSLNVYKKLNGNYANRPGQKRQGTADATLSAISSEFVWNTSWGAVLPLRVTNSKLQVRYNDVWYDLLTSVTDTRYVFDKWWDNTEKKDRVLMVNGNDSIQHWSGGVATVDSVTHNSAISIIGNNASLTQFGTITGTAPITAYQNSLTGTSQQSSIIFSSNPTNGNTLIFVLNAVPVSIQFVTTIGATPGNVLIGATLLDTLNNLIGLINSPGTTNANQVALSAPNQVLVGYITGAVTDTIKKTDPTISWQQAGFASNNVGEKKVIISGVEYTYQGGEATATLFGVTPDPTVIVAGTVALQSVITSANTPSDGFSNDFIKVINNQVYVGSYTSRLCYISDDTDFTNYTVPSPRAAGDPELLTLDSTLNGIGVRQGKAHISIGTGEWAVISFNDITVGSTLTQQTIVDVKPVASLQSAYAHEFIDTVGDSLVYLAQDQQVRMFGDFNNAFTPRYPSLSQEIAIELMEEDFTGGALKCIGEFTYLTAPVSGKTYLRQVREKVDDGGQVVSERLWHAPFIWNATRIDEISGVVVAFSNANPQVYEVWDTGQYYDDSPTDEALPYSSVMALSYRGGERRQGLTVFDKLFTEGFLTLGTPLNATINYNYQGVTAAVIVPINSTTRPAYIFAPDFASLGDSSLGDEPLGDGVETDPTTIAKFVNINSVNQKDSFEYQVIYHSEETDSQWEISAMGTNAIRSENQSTFIINKIRT